MTTFKEFWDAAQQGNIAIISQLKNNKHLLKTRLKDFMSKRSMFEELMYIAIINDHIDVVSALITLGMRGFCYFNINDDLRCTDRTTPIDIACKFGSINALNILRTMGARNIDRGRKSLIFTAIEFNQLEMVKIFIKLPISQKNLFGVGHGEIPLVSSIKMCNMDIYYIMLDYYKTNDLLTNTVLDNALLEAAEQNNLEILDELIILGANINRAECNQYRYLLHKSIYVYYWHNDKNIIYGCIKMVNRLIELGAYIYPSILVDAYNTNNLEIFKRILDINAPTLINIREFLNFIGTGLGRRNNPVYKYLVKNKYIIKGRDIELDDVFSIMVPAKLKWGNVF